ncbi:MAG: hypothetical protein ACTSYL_10800 [Candidatus Thorarchaeota archaeon]
MLSRGQIAQAIEFVDMIAQGNIEQGKVDDLALPEYVQKDTIFLTNRIRALMRLAPDETKEWQSLIQKRLRRDVPVSQRILINLGVCGLFGTILVYIGLLLAFAGRLLNTSILAPIIIATIIILILSVFSLLVAVRTNDDAKEHSRQQIDVPEIREASQKLIETIHQVLETELVCPIRLYLIGKYSWIYRSGTQFTTSSGVTLYESFILPRTFDLPLEWQLEDETLI